MVVLTRAQCWVSVQDCLSALFLQLRDDANACEVAGNEKAYDKYAPAAAMVKALQTADELKAKFVELVQKISAHMAPVRVISLS